MSRVADRVEPRGRPCRRPGVLRLFGVALPLAALLAACSFDEMRPGLDLPVPGVFAHAGLGGADRSVAAVARPAAPLPANWPVVFGSAELSHLAALTAHDNFDVAAAAARIREAEAQTAIASAPLFPVATSSDAADRNFTPGTLRSTSGTGRTVATNTFNLGLTASYELDLWGRNRFAGVAATENAVATRFARDTAVLSSVAAVTNSYLTLLSAQDRLKIADSNLRDARFGLEAIKGRLSVGTVTALEVAQQQSVVDQQLASFPPLQQQLQQAKTAIALLAGRAPESLAITGGSLAALKAPVIPPGLPAQVVRRRPDVAEAEATLGSADASVLSARAALFPRLTLTASGGIESAALKTLLSPAAAFGSMGAGLASPLIDGGALKGELDLERGRDLEDLQLYRKSVVQSLVDVENALIAVQQNTEHEKRLAAVVASARLAYDISKARLREGTIDILTVLNTEQTLFAALDAEAVVRLARFTALSSLAQAIGGGWTRPEQLEVAPLDGLTPVPAEAVAPAAPPREADRTGPGGYTAGAGTSGRSAAGGRT